MQKWYFYTKGHIQRTTVSEAPAISAPPVTEACKTHINSALSLARCFNFPSGFSSSIDFPSPGENAVFVLQINHLVKTAAGSISGHLFECNYMALPETGSDDGLMTPDTVLEPAGSARTSSGSGGYGGAVVDCMAALACTATTEVVRKKRTSCSTFRPPCRPACSPVSEMAEISAALMNRRKGNPQRAPLY